jgi:hypothetical protein
VVEDAPLTVTEGTKLEQKTVNGVEFTLTVVDSGKVIIETVDGIGGAARASSTVTIYLNNGTVSLVKTATYFNLVKNVSKKEQYVLPTGGTASITNTEVIR